MTKKPTVKKKRFIEPHTIETSVFLDEAGTMWSFASPNHNQEAPARIIREKDYQKLLRAAQRKPKQ